MNGKNGWGTEAKVGIFVLGALLLLGYMSLRVGKFTFLSLGKYFPGYRPNLLRCPDWRKMVGWKLPASKSAESKIFIWSMVRPWSI